MNKPASNAVSLLGGSGFIGRSLANRLLSQGKHLRILTRNREHARAAWLLPNVDVVELNSYDSSTLSNALKSSTAVVNLIGILNEGRDNGAGFRAAHVDITRNLAQACKMARVPHLVQMSALNADSFADSYYLRSKGEAEKLLVDAVSTEFRVSILRPSIVFGREDSFTNRFAQLLQLSPGILPLARADAKFQPVYVGDVSMAIEKILAQNGSGVERYDIGGPEVVEFGECVRWIANLIGSRTRVLPLNRFFSAVQANVLEYVPGKPFSRDNLRSLQTNSVCTQTNGLARLGINPRPMSEIVPLYLGTDTSRQRLYRLRANRGRDASGT